MAPCPPNEPWRTAGLVPALAWSPLYHPVNWTDTVGEFGVGRSFTALDHPGGPALPGLRMGRCGS